MFFGRIGVDCSVVCFVKHRYVCRYFLDWFFCPILLTLREARNVHLPWSGHSYILQKDASLCCLLLFISYWQWLRFSGDVIFTDYEVLSRIKNEAISRQTEEPVTSSSTGAGEHRHSRMHWPVPWWRERGGDSTLHHLCNNSVTALKRMPASLPDFQRQWLKLIPVGYSVRKIIWWWIWLIVENANFAG